MTAETAPMAVTVITITEMTAVSAVMTTVATTMALALAPEQVAAQVTPARSDNQVITKAAHNGQPFFIPGLFRLI